MIYAKKIRMKQGCANSNNTQEIADIYIDDCTNPGFFSKESLHNYLNEQVNNCIKVNISPYPNLIPVTSSKGEKYVRSEPNDTTNDNLLKLPRE